MENLRCTKKGTSLRYGIYFLLATVLFFGSVFLLKLDLTKFIQRFVNLPEVIGRMMQFNPTLLPEIIKETLVSICLAFTALVFGTAISFLFACLSAQNIAPNRYAACFIKGFIAMIRAVPALVWILMVVASVGFGNTGGMIGLIFPTVGYLTKSFTASFEEEGNERLDALRATGAGYVDIILKALVPQTAPKLLSWIAMRFENNIAEGISLGMIGVGGVGYLLNKAIMKFDYASITTIICVIFSTMLCMEFVMQNIKRKIHHR